MSAAAPHLHLVPDPAMPRAEPQPGVAAVSPDGSARKIALRRRPLGQILVDMRAVASGNLLKALALKDREDAALGDILLAHGWVSEADLMAGLSAQWGAKAIDLMKEPPDARLLDQIDAEFCLAHSVMPWHRIGGATVLATSRPDDFARMRAALPVGFGPVIMALALERDIHGALIAARQTTLIRRAETRVSEAESCRTQDTGFSRRLGIAALAATVAMAGIAPGLALGLALFWAVLTLLAFTGLKLACFVAEARAQARMQAPRPVSLPGRLPVVSVMVPLFREDDIAPRLIRRIGRIDYPKELLDILLVVEEDDSETLAALGRHDLPRWMRIVTVPGGPIRTKPRALNYALNFCRGSIIGIWDAEDAPDPQQIHKIVRRFAGAEADVACLQGILDFYNARHNWLTRCFAVEYASWFRTFLPGLARLGFVVPLGGTTLFFRRAVLEELGGWDAHNVTEDADLGVRLARHSYRTELVDTVTEEEPNAGARSWVRQRSRWQKGFAITWATHMRDPLRLWQQLGPKRFWGIQILFVGSLSQALLAPVLWSFWPVAFGMTHPLSALLPTSAITALCLLFIGAEIITMVVGIWATRGGPHRHLQKWVPTMHFYFPLATLSSYKALYEWITRPFFWDKTAHGVVAARAGDPDLLPILVLSDPVHVPAAEIEVVPLHILQHLPSRLHLSDPPDAGRGAGPLPSERDALRAPAPPEPAEPHPAASARPATRRRLALASRRAGVKLQPGFEGL